MRQSRQGLNTASFDHKSAIEVGNTFPHPVDILAILKRLCKKATDVAFQMATGIVLYARLPLMQSLL
jgi:hypothetical protein